MADGINKMLDKQIADDAAKADTAALASVDDALQKAGVPKGKLLAARAHLKLDAGHIGANENGLAVRNFKKEGKPPELLDDYIKRKLEGSAAFLLYKKPKPDAEGDIAKLAEAAAYDLVKQTELVRKVGEQRAASELAKWGSKL